MGGRSKSSNSTTTKNLTDIFETSGAVYDSSVGDGQRINVNVSGSKNDAKITTTDHGAVKAAFATVSDVVSEITGVVSSSEKRQAETLSAVTGLAKSTTLAGKDLELKTLEKIGISIAISLSIIFGFYFSRSKK